jgi:hypothetical protein
MKLNENVKWTKEWKDATLKSIKRKYKHLFDNSECQCCKMSSGTCDNNCAIYEICQDFIDLRNETDSEQKLKQFLVEMENYVSPVEVEE